MSDSISENQAEVASSDEKKQEDSFVSKKAYQGVQTDMHKYKSQYKEAMARANELEAQLKAEQEEKMREQNQYKELYEQKEEELSSYKNTVHEKEQRYVDTAKRAALRAELGNIRGEYLMHASINDISLNEDGTVNSESVRDVANKFREEHAVLLPKTEGNTSTALPATNEPHVSELRGEELQKKLEGMSIKEKIELMKSLSKEN